VDTGTWLDADSCLHQTPWRVVVCREGARRVAFAVHQLLGQREIVHKSLGEYLRGVRWFAGATLLGDGRIALIADVHHWLSLTGRPSEVRAESVGRNL
ncbi:MAG: chemotaxis protein CheW, partial [Alicyclobacillus sp.]|nr:chemotaxis protein CheW [Alicyclobacillus sp.]